eukprot:SAG31_NODE_35_length_31836_cov_10.841352_5_plen_218_part_00
MRYRPARVRPYSVDSLRGGRRRRRRPGGAAGAHSIWNVKAESRCWVLLFYSCTRTDERAGADGAARPPPGASPHTTAALLIVSAGSSAESLLPPRSRRGSLLLAAPRHRLLQKVYIQGTEPTVQVVGSSISPTASGSAALRLSAAAKTIGRKWRRRPAGSSDSLCPDQAREGSSSRGGGGRRRGPSPKAGESACAARSCVPWHHSDAEAGGRSQTHM